MKLTTGQRVRVEFEGTVHSVHGSDEMIYVNSGRHTYTAYVPVEHVTVLDPAHWPPQIGDIWEAGGFEYMIRSAHSMSSSSYRKTEGWRNDGYGIVSPLDSGAPSLRGRYDELLAASPKLLRRRGGFSA